MNKISTLIEIFCFYSLVYNSFAFDFFDCHQKIGMVNNSFSSLWMISYVLRHVWGYRHLYLSLCEMMKTYVQMEMETYSNEIFLSCLMAILNVSEFQKENGVDH